MIDIKEKSNDDFILLSNNELNKQMLFKFGQVTNFHGVSTYQERGVAYFVLNDFAKSRNNNCVIISKSPNYEMISNWLKALAIEVNDGLMFEFFIDFENIIEFLNNLDEKTIILLDEMERTYFDREYISNGKIFYCMEKLIEIAKKKNLCILTISNEYDLAFDAEQIEVSTINGEIHLKSFREEKSIMFFDGKAD